MGELHRDIAAADQDDAARQRVEVQEVFAGCDQFGPFDRQRNRLRSGGYHEMIGFQQLAVHVQRIGADEPGGTVKRGDPGIGEGFFLGLGALDR